MFGLAGVTGYMACFAWALENGGYDAWSTMLIAPALVLISLPLLRYVVRLESDGRVAVIIVVAFFVKLGAALLNHAVAFRLYGGVADARGYHGGGVVYSQAFRAGQLAPPEDLELGRRFIKTVTGLIYTVTGPSKLGGYLIFAWLAFWGLYLFYRAFVRAVPGGDARRYAVLVLLLPSILFWTSAIGKEAWMTLALGVTAMGAARLLTRHRGGLILFGLGLGASALCRPHLGLITFIAVLAAYIWRRAPSSRRLGPLATVASLVVLLALGAFVASRFAHQVDLKSFDARSVEEVRRTTNEDTELGGSRSGGPSGPLTAPGVLFRPLPFEAHNIASLAASLEGTAMLVLFIASWRRLVSAPRTMLRHVYVMFCVGYSAMFLLAFSGFRNFGLLARERVQVFPFVLVLLALPLAHRLSGRAHHDAPHLPSTELEGEKERLATGSASIS